MRKDRGRRLEWVEPLAFARGFAHLPCMLLYSGMRNGYSGRYSLFGHGPARVMEAYHFAPLGPLLSHNGEAYENAWFGYLGYGLLHDLEKIEVAAPSVIPLPRLWMAQFAHLYVFDHEAGTLDLYESPPSPPSSRGLTAGSGEAGTARGPAVKPRDDGYRVGELQSTMSKAEYLDKVGRIREAIHAGEFYQANLTRKFHGRFSGAPDAFALFEDLCAASPAPYAAYINTGRAQVLSSSPERFLQADAGGRVESRPIKGTAPRHAEREPDAVGRARLAGSGKDRAENLMIVDLMRNDLARGCVPGSVHVENLFDVATYATLHHMDSTIIGQKREDVSTLRLVEYCFPPGSMTGAPKIRAMQYCAQLEGIERGVYSGALGWFGGDGSCDLSVVIRTLVIEGDRFEFQVGGAITAESEPEAEWRETMTKARGICTALGIAMERLENL